MSIPLTNGSILTTVNVSMKGAQIKIGVIFRCDIRRGYCGRNASNPTKCAVAHSMEWRGGKRGNDDCIVSHLQQGEHLYHNQMAGTSTSARIGESEAGRVI